MEDYHFHCFHTSWRPSPSLKRGSQATPPPTPSPSARRRHCGHATQPKTTIPPSASAATTSSTPCGRCGRLHGQNKDIFMYRGDTPFCSEECRQQEMDADETRERRSSKQPAAAAAKRAQEQQRQSSGDTQTIQVWALSIVS